MALQATSLGPVPTPPPEIEVPAATTASSAPSPEPAAADEPGEPPTGGEVSEELKQRGLGYLTVHSSAQHASVYVNLKPRGKVEERLTVPCGNRFVSIGVPFGRSGEPSWLAPGKMMLVPCGGPLNDDGPPRCGAIDPGP
jgi:hypothetical protein